MAWKIPNNPELFTLCLEKNIPIIRNQTAELIKDIILENDYHSLLEIGTAYGYSTDLWTSIETLNKIVSIEKREDNYAIAQRFLQQYPQVTLVCGDAFEFVPNQKFDLIFIDGPKSHQIELIQHYMKFLDSKGTIVIDNMWLKKFRDLPVEDRSKNQNQLIQKLDEFKDWLVHLTDWDFKLIPIDDGVGILKKL